MEKVIRIGNGPNGNVYCKVSVKNEDGKGPVLSVSGVEGPLMSGNAKGSCGQILDHITITEFALGWDASLLSKFEDMWRRWHLNDMRAACEHQMADSEFNPKEELEVIDFTWSNKYHSTRAKAASGELLPEEYSEFKTISPMVLAVTTATNRQKFMTSNIKALISEGWVKEKGRETKTAGWATVEEHPKGLLGKVCPKCGYKYGSAWLYEPLPQAVIDFIALLPETDVTPAWV